MYKSVFVFGLCSLLTGDSVVSGSGANDFVDYSIMLAKQKIQNLGLATIFLKRDALHNKDTDNPKLYDFTSIQRMGDVTVQHSSQPDLETIDLAVKIGLTNLVLQFDINWALSHGAARVHLEDNGVTVGIHIEYTKENCTMKLSKNEVKLRGMYVDVWGLTQIGDNAAKSQIRDAYNNQIGGLEGQGRDAIQKYFDSFASSQAICQLVKSIAID
ncbi:Hypothetical protein NTJ_15348 [Nesidiocoris tenuis]|uniref:Lipid-binding serum glycoprotein N-terminal domain-containing protein n=1 Tax=Nesidiocoris tenuis TaxID=355587 RepID=A0ABN7BF91_9HEMI|nr:Hypothetical protein NTJ_15348 [Nesidiocoris tenuis]